MLCQLSYRGIVHGTLLVAHQKKIVAHSEKNCCTLKKKKVAHLKKNEQISSKVLTLKTGVGHQKKNLHVRESNPGRLRDRQKCYQLHQRGKPPARIELATLRLLSACSARLSYRGTCMLPTRIELAPLG